MKKILIAAGVLIAIIIVIVVLLLMRRPAAQNGGQPSVSFPSGGQQTTATSTPSASDFLSNPAVTQDPNNPGYYSVGQAPAPGHQISDTPYQITYIADTKYFSISLTQEPLGESRLKAETYLAQLLGVTKDQLCLLNYGVYVPNDVNTNYAGTNLGFSSCPGAVTLPF